MSKWLFFLIQFFFSMWVWGKWEFDFEFFFLYEFCWIGETRKSSEWRRGGGNQIEIMQEKPIKFMFVSSFVLSMKWNSEVERKCQGLVDCWTRQVLRVILMCATSKKANCGDESFQLVVVRAQLACDRHFHDVETWWTLNDVITFTVRTHHRASEFCGRFLFALLYVNSFAERIAFAKVFL